MICIDKEKCNGDAVCTMLCPAEALKIGDDGKAEIDNSLCMECFACKSSCSQEAIYEG